MKAKKRMIYADDAQHIADVELSHDDSGTVQWVLSHTPTVDAVEVVRVEAVKQEILAKMDEFYAEYRRISESHVDHFGGKADAMDVARRLVNAALTDLCESCRTKTAGGKADGK